MTDLERIYLGYIMMAVALRMLYVLNLTASAWIRANYVRKKWNQSYKSILYTFDKLEEIYEEMKLSLLDGDEEKYKIQYEEYQNINLRKEFYKRKYKRLHKLIYLNLNKANPFKYYLKWNLKDLKKVKAREVSDGRDLDFFQNLITMWQLSKELNAERKDESKV